MKDRFAGSRAHQDRAKKSLAGGVATASRASQKPVPICFDHGSGATLRRFTAALLEGGVHVIPKGLMYVSAAHTTADVEATAAAVTVAAVRAASMGQHA
jgi:glutamate-1-semialdehyde aminotransferase